MDLWTRSIVLESISEEYYYNNSTEKMMSALSEIRPKRLNLEMMCVLLENVSSEYKENYMIGKKMRDELQARIWEEIVTGRGGFFPLSGRCEFLINMKENKSNFINNKIILDDVKQETVEFDSKTLCILNMYYDQKYHTNYTNYIDTLEEYGECNIEINKKDDLSSCLDEIVKHYDNTDQSEKAKWLEERIKKGPIEKESDKNRKENIDKNIYVPIDFRRYSAYSGNYDKTNKNIDNHQRQKELYDNSKMVKDIFRSIKRIINRREKGFLLARINYQCQVVVVPPKN